MTKQPGEKKQGKFWVSLLTTILLIMLLASLFRLYGLLVTRTTLISMELPPYLMTVLIATTILNIGLASVAFVSMVKGTEHCTMMTWIAFLSSLSAYWLERLILWPPETRFSGNFVFMIGMSFLGLLLLVLFTRAEKRAERLSHDGGN